VFAAFAGVLDEPVPERLLPAPGGQGHVRVDVLAQAKARPLPARWSWRQWGGMAASLAAGVLAGALGWQQMSGGDAAPFSRAGDAIVARGELADALSRQLAADAPVGAVRVGVSFAAKGGEYCRSFQLGSTAGLACREGGEWRIPVLAQDAQSGHAAYRQAASAMPAAVLEAIDERIAGTSLDAAAERDARARGWQQR
jgi:hypothetical protein